jgi:8-oxo-dGTP pyrophosphatase MutT (NUDIX family)
VSIASRLLGVRAAIPARRGNAAPPKGGAANVYYSAPGIPQIPEWDGQTALRNGYLASLYVMRCARKTAEKLASFPFRAGADPDNPGDFNPLSPLSQLLGPASRHSPGGPNPQWSARQFWIWSIIQRQICGRMAWETVTTQSRGQGDVAAMWPLVAPFLMPVPSGSQRSSQVAGLMQTPYDLSGPNPSRYFDGFQYQLPTGNVDYSPDEIFYSWRPSQLDPRQPESVLQAASLPVSLQVGLERYLWALAKNGMVGKTLVVTPPFDEDDEEAAFRSQFLSEFTGYDNGGKTMFATVDDDSGDPSRVSAAGAAARNSVQALKLDNSPTDAQALDLLKAMYEQIRVAFGTPKSKLVDATDSTYANAGQDDLNWIEDEIIPLGREIQDDINSRLAPRLGDDVGWFDFSEALKPRGIFAAVDPVAAKGAGLIKTNDWRTDVGLEVLADDTPEAPVVAPAPEPPAIEGARAATKDGPVAAGLAVKALDTGRVLMLQRAITDDDPASGTWEFPGGKLEPDEDPFAAAVREWQEEVGCSLPQGRVAGAWTSPNGIYRGFVYLVSSEALVTCNLDHEDRHVLNPDDPDGDQIEVVAWWNPAQLPAMSALRPEARKSTDWHLLATAGATRGDEQLLDCGHRAGTCTGPGPCDTAPFGAGKNWVNKVGGLPAYIRAVAHAFARQGHSESEAIERAVGVVRNWAEGKQHVTPATRARAVKAIAEWEAKKAASHATRDALTESSSAGSLLPVAPMPRVVTRQHMFVPSKENRRKCAVTGCGQGVTAAVHGLSGRRHAGPGHHRVSTGHLARSRRQTLDQVHRQADSLEPAVVKAMAGLFAAQRKATVDRLTGRRGQQMIRAATPPPPDDPQQPDQRAPLVDAGQVYDLAHWVAKTRDVLDPVLSAVVSLTADRFAGQLGEHPSSSSLAGVQQVLDARLLRLAQTVSQTTFDDVAQVLRHGVVQGQTITQMTAALEQVFSDAEANRAPMIARTETIGALNEAAATYADNLSADVVSGREWLAAHDDRVRTTHREADGQIRAMGEPYLVGGAAMAFPHDPAAPPDEVINCRCTQAFLTPAEYAKRTQPASAAA